MLPRPGSSISRLRAWLAGPGPPRALADVRLGNLAFVAVDLETTGLDPRRDAPVAMAAIPFRAGAPCLDAAFDRIVDPGRPIPEAARAIHGIGADDVRGAPSALAALPAFLATCGDAPLVAHTAAFDLAVLARLARSARLAPPPGPALDVGLLAHALFPSWWDLSLEGLGRLLEVPVIGRHTARGDALTAGAIFLRMAPMLAARGMATLADALAFQRHRGRLPPAPPPPR